jgi:hypothetical protein
VQQGCGAVAVVVHLPHIGEHRAVAVANPLGGRVRVDLANVAKSLDRAAAAAADQLSG